jgi:hypothetical protein
MKQAFIVLLTCCFYQVAAQNEIPNPGFEDWENDGTFFNSYQNPQGWGTLNSATSLLGVETVKRTTNSQFVHSGNAAIKLETFYINLLNRPAQGICVTGNINIDTEEIEGGLSYNLRPDNFSGWYQYYPAGADTGQAAAILTKWNSVLQQRDTIAIAGKWFLGQTDVYQQFDEPFEYGSEESPDTLMVILVSSSQFEPVIGSVMYIDDLNLNFTTLVQNSGSKSNIFVYPIPALDFIHFEFSENGIFEIFALNGNMVSSGIVNVGLNRISVDNWPSGIYLLKISTPHGELIGFSRIVVVK